MRTLRLTLRNVAFICRIAAALIIALMMITITYDVVLRYAFGQPTTWVLEVNAIALVALTFLAMPDLFARNEHISMELHSFRLSGLVARWAVGIFGLALTILGLITTVASIRAGLLSPGMNPIPLWVVYAFLPFGGAIMLLLAIFTPARERDRAGASEVRVR